MARPGTHIPTHRERSALKALIDKQRLTGVELFPAGPSTIFAMIGKGWIERKQDAGGFKYRITTSGRVAMKTAIPSIPLRKAKGK